MYKGSIFNIMVGSPSDVFDVAMKAVECINNWNAINVHDRHIALVPHHWTSSSYPSLSKTAQSHIDDIIVDRSDALVAIIGSRLGTPTQQYQSGTVEEIEEHRKAGKPVMVFFSDKFDSTQDIEQIKSVLEYRKQLVGLYETFNGIADFEKKFTTKLHLLIQNELFPLIPTTDIEDATQKKVSFSEDEIELVKKWCHFNSNYFSKTNFIGGSSLFSFGGMAVETSSPKETAEMDDFINRLLMAGFIESDGFNKQGNQKFKLTLLAYQTFCD